MNKKQRFSRVIMNTIAITDVPKYGTQCRSIQRKTSAETQNFCALAPLPFIKSRTSDRDGCAPNGARSGLSNVYHSLGSRLLLQTTILPEPYLRFRCRCGG